MNGVHVKTGFWTQICTEGRHDDTERMTSSSQGTFKATRS